MLLTTGCADAIMADTRSQHKPEFGYNSEQMKVSLFKDSALKYRM